MRDKLHRKAIQNYLDGSPEQARAAAHGRRLAMPWYRRAFQEDYLEIYMHRDLEEAVQAVRFLGGALSLGPRQRLLDLCCGPGRHLALLGQEVGQAVGLDLSRALLLRAQDRWREECPAAKANHAQGNIENQEPDYAGLAPLIQGDMRSLPLAEGRFDRVVNLFTSFGYFEEEADNFAVLREIARVLKSTDGEDEGAGKGAHAKAKANGDEGPGMLALDHINREAMLAGFKPQSERPLPGGRRLVEKRRWDEATRRVTKDIVCLEPGGQFKAWCESVRVYEPEELVGLLEQAGLEVTGRYGNYDGSPWSPLAPRLILIGRKRAL